MHEIFLTAQVADEDLPKALRILQGYCGMQPVAVLRRRLIYEGPKTRTPKGLEKKFLEATSMPKKALWTNLSEQITRQSYIITLLYDITNDQLGRNAPDRANQDGPEIDYDQILGTLRWNDLPEPGAGRLVNSRLIVNIENEMNLGKILTSQSHRFTGEIIQDCRRFIHNNVTFELNRYLQFPARENETPPTIRKQLPPFDAFLPFDSENKWVLTASAMVLNGTDPVQMQKGIDELVAIKNDFEGCFDLQMMDRHIFDTRVKF